MNQIKNYIIIKKQLLNKIKNVKYIYNNNNIKKCKYKTIILLCIIICYVNYSSNIYILNNVFMYIYI